ncbi:MAG TPA: hypothetical protein ENJ77_00275 [Candidatus Moranbacteria bacterium]|nr:hypothetical protein [Candidatus Moranbacteria bacterium]
MPEKLRKIHLLVRFLLLAVFAGVLLFATDRILFPPLEGSFDFANPNALKNTLAVENDGRNLVVYIGVYSPYDRAELELALSSAPKKPSREEVSVSVRRGWRAFFSPILTAPPVENEEKKSELPFPPGSALAWRGGVYLVGDEGKISPVDEARTFSAFGYSFDAVRSTKGVDMSAFDKTRAFNILSPHPTGTIFRLEETDRRFRLTREGLVPVSPTTPAPAGEIPADMSSREEAVVCRLSKLNDRRLLCRADLRALESIGNVYRFEIRGLSPERVRRAKVVLRRKRSLEAAKEALARAKKRLLLNY